MQRCCCVTVEYVLFTRPGEGHPVRLQAGPPGELRQNGAAVPSDRGERQEGRQDPRLQVPEKCL